jgi:hypothetical protein
VPLNFKILTLIILMFYVNIDLQAQTDASGGDQSSAASPSAATGAKSVRKQTLNFEDELVQGTAQKPDLFYLFQRKGMNQGRLIKLRQNFLPEMRKTTEDIQRVRGGH